MKNSVLTCSIALLAVAACSAPGKGNGDAGASSVQKTVGTTGGTVVNGDTTVSIPAGALSGDTMVSVTSTPNASPPPDATTVGVPYTFGPEGQQFTQPVTVTLAFDPSKLPAGATTSNIVVFTAPAGTTNFTSLGGTLVDATHISAQTMHFSVFVPGVGGDADAGFTSNADGGSSGMDGGNPNSDGGMVESDGGSSGNDGGSVSSDGGSSNPDGGSVQSDGGSSGTDGGSVSSDGGSSNPDGGSVESDAGSSGTDGGSAQSDGGSANPDGGSVQSDAGSSGTDGGSVSSDGGSVGPNDGGAVDVDAGSPSGVCDDIDSCIKNSCVGEWNCAVMNCLPLGTDAAQQLANNLHNCEATFCYTGGGDCDTGGPTCVGCLNTVDNGVCSGDFNTCETEVANVAGSCSDVLTCEESCNGDSGCINTCASQANATAQSWIPAINGCLTTYCSATCAAQDEQCGVCEDHYTSTANTGCYATYQACNGVAPVCHAANVCTDESFQRGSRLFELWNNTDTPTATGGVIAAGTYIETNAVIFTSTGGPTGYDGSYVLGTVVVSNVTDSSEDVAIEQDMNGCPSAYTGSWNFTPSSTTFQWQTTCPNAQSLGNISYTASGDGLIIYQPWVSGYTRADYFTKIF